MKRARKRQHETEDDGAGVGSLTQSSVGDSVPEKAPERTQSSPQRKRQRAVAKNAKMGGWIERLEVENFKSHKGHQIIGPFRQFQCIIGPNGAGKSNLMDAISFVLGITTRHLRGTQLKDLVYRGEGEEAARKKAFVELVYKPLDESEGEMIFRRTILPNGTAEYRYNGKVVSAEDYNDTLREIGILVKARNFLVFQGDVEQIAQKQPKDLATLFETISGSEEHKVEYEEALKAKIAAEESTIFTFKKRKGISVEKKQYRQQKEEADRFRELQSDLLAKKLEHVLFQLFHIGREHERIQEDLRKERKEEKKKEERMKRSQETLTAKKKEQGVHQKKFLEVEANVQKKKKVIAKKKPGHIKLKQEIDHLKKRLARSRQDLEAKEGDYTKQQAELKDLERMLTDVNKAMADFEKELKKAGKGSDLTLLESQVEEYNKCKEQAARATAAEQQELKQLQREQDSDRTKLETLKLKMDEHAEKLVALAKNREETVERQAKVQAYIDANVTELDVLKAQYNDLATQNRKDKDRHKEVTEQLKRVTERLAEARADVRQSEHETRMGEALDAMRRLYTGVHGRVTDLCKPVQRRYNVAVTVAMGKNMDAIVTDTEATARECIQYLRENRVGTATFIPLDAIRVKAPSEKLRQLGGTSKLVIDLLTFEPYLTRAIQHAVGTTLCCDTLDEARHVAYDGDERQKVVTLDGTKISKAGLITGGVAGMDKKAATWDEGQVEGLKKDKDRYQKELYQLGSRRKQEAQERDLDAQIKGLENRLKHSRTDLTATEEKLDSLDTQSKALETERSRLQPEIKGLSDAIARRETAMAAIEKKTHKVEDKIFQAFSQSVGVANIREYEETRLKAAQEHSKRRLDLSKQRDKLQNQLEFERAHDLQGPLDALRGSIEAESARVAELQTDEAAHHAEIEELTGELRTLEKEAKDAKKVVDDLDTAAKEIKKTHDAAVKELLEVQRHITTHESTMEQLRNKRHTVYQRCTVDEIRVPLKGGGELQDEDIMGAGRASQSQSQGADNSEAAAAAYRAEDDIEVDFDRLPKTFCEDMTPAEIDKVEADFLEKHKQMANDIDRMAPNLKALDRLDDVTNRLKDTGEEFEAARRAAREATTRFEDVKKLRTDKFKGAFDHIARAINDIYQRLTSDEDSGLKGTAYLSLENEDEPYLAGVKYTAQPPHKRFRDMVQLSGGEKTVAALALLFAIHRFRPSPFFVLDEVDAALDNANVNRVSHFIRESSNQFQCIVISLKDSFYDKAEALVGIYRDQARGCSATMSLDLTQYVE